MNSKSSISNADSVQRINMNALVQIEFVAKKKRDDRNNSFAYFERCSVEIPCDAHCSDMFQSLQVASPVKLNDNDCSELN